MLQVLSSRKELSDILASAKARLTENYPDASSRIETLIQKFLKKSPTEAFLKEKAYKWLQYLQNFPPVNASWYPDRAIEVAHKVFRLKGKLRTFLHYLANSSRSRVLKSRDAHSQGIWLDFTKQTSSLAETLTPILCFYSLEFRPHNQAVASVF